MGKTKTDNVWKSYIAILFGVFMMMLILGMNTPAYPRISADLNISNAYISWMTAFFSMASAVLAPVMGKISDIIGLKKIMIIGFCSFAAGCFVMSVAPVFAVMLLGRFLQGIGLACSTPAALSYAGRFFPPDKSSTAYAVFAGTCNAGPIFGPFLSGFLVENVGWRTMFAMGGCGVAVGLILLVVIMPNSPILQQQKKKFDSFGAAFLLVAVGSLLLLPTLASQMGWTSPLALLLMGLFVVFIYLFIRTENKAEAPIVNLKFVKSRNFLIPTIPYFVTAGIQQAFLYMMSYFMTAGLGLPATMTGTWTMILFISSTAFTPVAAFLLRKFSWKSSSFIVLVFYASAALLFSTAGPSVSILTLMLGAVLLGFGTGLIPPLSTNVCLSTVAPEDRGAASGTFRLASSELGGPMGVQVFVPLMSILAVKPDGSPDFVAAFPRVSMIMLVVICSLLVFTIMYPKKPAAVENSNPKK